MGTLIEIQRTKFTYVVYKNKNSVGSFDTEKEARDLARGMSQIILRSDRQRMEANQEAIKNATPYTPTETTTETQKPASFSDIAKRLGGIGQTRISTVAKGSLTKISASQEEALINSIKHCSGRIYRGGKLITGNNGGKIALTLTQLYALEKRGFVTLIEENFQVHGAWVTDSCKRMLGLA